MYCVTSVSHGVEIYFCGLLDTGYLCIYLILLSPFTASLTFSFYPTAPKGCRGIVFTHGDRIGGRAGGRKKFVRTVSQKPSGVGS